MSDDWFWRMTGLFGNGHTSYANPADLAGRHAIDRDPARMMEHRRQGVMTAAGWWDENTTPADPEEQ